MTTRLHPSADIDLSASIAPTARVGAFSVIERGVHLGHDAVVGPLCRIAEGTRIGDGCTIQSGAMIGGPPQDREYRGEASFCEIGDGTDIREHVTVHRGSRQGTWTRVGRRCLLMANSHVGHDCCVGDDVTLVNGALLAGHVHVGARAVVSGNAAVHQFVRIGEGAMIGGLSKITQDVTPFFMFDGPGTVVGINRVGLRRMGATSDEIDGVRQAYRVLCRESHSLFVARQLLEALPRTRYVTAIVDFFAHDSRRGFHLRTRTAAGGSGHRKLLSSDAQLADAGLEP